MSTLTPAQIEADVVEMLRNFPGREYADEIGPETLFFADLGFRSIDAVVLGEMLEKHYSRKLPFHELLADATPTGEQDLRVGKIVRFLERHLASAGESTGGGK